MGDIEAPGSRPPPPQNALLSVLPSKEFCSSKKGMLLLAEVALSFISFVCFAASEAAAFVTVPLLEFLAALFLLFAYSTKFNERFKGFLWPLMDFMRCVTASVIFFIVSIMAVSKYVDGSSKAAGVFGFIATIVFALDFYLIFNELATFLKQGGETTEEPSRQQGGSDYEPTLYTAKLTAPLQGKKPYEFSDSDSD
ncbi:CKLF-like MARVEL transmembrane domain-containing protein 3 isoform X1 [Pleuronectes platessa]|uniref:CKLF-like MARVEL transmembrane domain-containing protein 3 isoform X1 n=1 Tax=Pleuronectes platessa TaxID=8262 RepID=UPI00232A1688|nr:CKLF-like MARVEL transmembrane domain-containing protein 3 isoform X1 [Pleuronectes platessa]